MKPMGPLWQTSERAVVENVERREGSISEAVAPKALVCGDALKAEGPAPSVTVPRASGLSS